MRRLLVFVAVVLFLGSVGVHATSTMDEMKRVNQSGQIFWFDLEGYALFHGGSVWEWSHRTGLDFKDVETFKADAKAMAKSYGIYDFKFIGDTFNTPSIYAYLYYTATVDITPFDENDKAMLRKQHPDKSGRLPISGEIFIGWDENLSRMFFESWPSVGYKTPEQLEQVRQWTDVEQDDSDTPETWQEVASGYTPFNSTAYLCSFNNGYMVVIPDTGEVLFIGDSAEKVASYDVICCDNLETITTQCAGLSLTIDYLGTDEDDLDTWVFTRETPESNQFTVQAQWHR